MPRIVLGFAMLLSFGLGAEESCVDVRARLKVRFNELPAPLRQLGGERKAVRRYLHAPSDYFKEGASTACNTTTTTGDLRHQPKHQCPQSASVTFNFPSVMARDPESSAPVETVYISFNFSSILPAPHLELPLSSIKANGDGFDAEAPNRTLHVKRIDPRHVYLEWTQRSDVESQRELRVLIESDGRGNDFERAVPTVAECR